MCSRRSTPLFRWKGKHVLCVSPSISVSLPFSHTFSRTSVHKVSNTHRQTRSPGEQRRSLLLSDTHALILYIDSFFHADMQANAEAKILTTAQAKTHLCVGSSHTGSCFVSQGWTQMHTEPEILTRRHLRNRKHPHTFTEITTFVGLIYNKTLTV